MVLSLTKLEPAPPEAGRAYVKSALWAVKGHPLMLVHADRRGWEFFMRSDASEPRPGQHTYYEALCAQRFPTRRQALQAAEMALMMIDEES